MIVYGNAILHILVFMIYVPHIQNAPNPTYRIRSLSSATASQAASLSFCAEALRIQNPEVCKKKFGDIISLNLSFLSMIELLIG